MPPVASTTAREAMVTGLAVASFAVRNCSPATAPSSVRSASATQPSITRIEGVERTASISADMIALPAMSQRQCTIERDAIMEQVVDTGAGFARQSQGYGLIDQARADGDRIGGMCLRTVAFGD